MREPLDSSTNSADLLSDFVLLAPMSMAAGFSVTVVFSAADPMEEMSNEDREVATIFWATSCRSRSRCSRRCPGGTSWGSRAG